MADAPPISRVVAYPHAARDRPHLEYQLTLLQPPEYAVACPAESSTPLTSTMIHPPPVLQLRVIAHTQPVSHDLTDPPTSPPSSISAQSLCDPAPGRTSVTTPLGSGSVDPAWFLGNPSFIVFAALVPEHPTPEGRPDDGRLNTDTDTAVDVGRAPPSGPPSSAATSQRESGLDGPDTDPPPASDELGLLPDGSGRAYTAGTSVSSLYQLNGGSDTTPPPSSDALGVFIFPALSIRVEGTFRLKFHLFERVGHNLCHCKVVYSSPFPVVTPPRAPAAPGAGAAAHKAVKLPHKTPSMRGEDGLASSVAARPRRVSTARRATAGASGRLSQLGSLDSTSAGAGAFVDEFGVVRTSRPPSSASGTSTSAATAPSSVPSWGGGGTGARSSTSVPTGFVRRASQDQAPQPQAHVPVQVATNAVRAGALAAHSTSSSSTGRRGSMPTLILTAHLRTGSGTWRHGPHGSGRDSPPVGVGPSLGPGAGATGTQSRARARADTYSPYPPIRGDRGWGRDRDRGREQDLYTGFGSRYAYYSRSQSSSNLGSGLLTGVPATAPYPASNTSLPNMPSPALPGYHPSGPTLSPFDPPPPHSSCAYHAGSEFAPPLPLAPASGLGSEPGEPGTPRSNAPGFQVPVPVPVFVPLSADGDRSLTLPPLAPIPRAQRRGRASTGPAYAFGGRAGPSGMSLAGFAPSTGPGRGASSDAGPVGGATRGGGTTGSGTSGSSSSKSMDLERHTLRRPSDVRDPRDGQNHGGSDD